MRCVPTKDYIHANTPQEKGPWRRCVVEGFARSGKGAIV